MGDDITYLDLLVLKKLDKESTVEKFGMKINTSFFDTANLIGSMKIKGLVNIESSIVGGQSPIMITGEGRDLISSAIQKAGEPIDTLDQTILNALVSGVRDLTALQKVINIRARDLAFHLYKLKSYDYIDQTVQSAKVNFSLTEKGFLLTKGYRSSIKASDLAKKKQEKEQKSTTAQPKKQESKKSGSIEDEIRDLFNFKSYNKAKDYKKPEEKKPQITDAQKESPKDKSQNKLPPFMKKSPPKKAMDRQKMLMSKLDFYVQRYAIFAILILIMLVLLVFAVLFALFS